MHAVAKILPVFCLKKIPMVLYEKGYQLVEVLIALLILMIAVTTIGGVQIFSLKNNRHSSHHITALSLLQDIGASMRANAKATNNERYATQFSQTVPESKKCINTNNTCSSAELAQSELALWKKNIRDTFFQGEGEILFSRVDNQLYANITIRWNDSADNLSDNEKICIKEGGKLSCQTLFINFCNAHSAAQICAN